MADDSSKRITVIAVSSIILVAMIIALTVGTLSKNPDDNKRVDISESTKAIKTICDSTDYKDVCIKSLNSTAGNATDPKELIEAAFQVTIKHLMDASSKSVLLQELEKDPKTKLALENCQELADRAVSDLEKSFGTFQSFDFNNLKDLLNDLKIWISGAITYQETCLDGFVDTPGDAGKKMREVLKTSMQLTSNGLAMITDVSSVITSLDILPSFHNRRLLSGNPLGHGDEDLDFPDWVDSKSRMLIDVDLNETKPDLIVAKDGSGKYTTINEALKDIPTKSNKTFILYIKEGVYTEKVLFYRNLTHLMVIGDGPTKTRITGSLNFIDGVPTYHTATVAVLGEYFIAKDIGFENSAGPEKHQAVALRVGADKSMFYNCQMDGYQDTLYAHAYRQFYRDCVISGTIDFIFGDSAVVFQNCKMVVRKPLANQQCIVTAQGRKDVREPTGLVLQNCSIVADPAYYPLRNKMKSYLGRPWKEFSRTIIMESYIDELIQPEGWLPWEGTFALNTLFYTEFNNRGPGSVKSKRVKWLGVKELQATRVERYTAARFIDAETWIPASGLPFNSSFMFPLPKENASATYSPVAPEEVKDLGLPKEENPTAAADFMNGSINIAPATSPPPPPPPPPPAPAPAPADLSNIASPPPLGSGLSPSPAPINAASSPMNAVSPSPQSGVSPSLAPTTNTASPSLAPTPSIGATPPAPAVSPTPQSGVSPSPAPNMNTASPPQESGSPPAPTPDNNSASPSPQVSVVSPAQTPASSPQQSTTPPAPAPAPSTNSATAPSPTQGTTPPAPAPAPTPSTNSASPPSPKQGTTPPAPAPAPSTNSASPPSPTQGTTPPAPTPSMDSASPPVQDTTPPAPAPINSASPPVQGGDSAPQSSPPTSSGASVNSPTSLPAASTPSLSPSSQ